MPLISVLMTAHNREKYIADAIRSVLAQTYSDFELIIVDDASTDKTVEQVEPFVKDPRVVLHRNDHKMGQFENRNHAAALAGGTYIKYVDSDDLIYPHCLQVMLDSMLRFPMAGAGISRKPRRDQIYPMMLEPREAWQQAYLGYGSLGNAPNSSIYKRETFDQVGGFPIGPIMSDAFLLHRIASITPIVYMTAGMDWYRVHPQQVSHTINDYDWKMVEPVKHLPEYLFSAECPLLTDERELVYKNVVANFLRYCVRSAVRGQMLFALRSFLASGLSFGALRYLFHQQRRPHAGKDHSPDTMIYPRETSGISYSITAPSTAADAKSD